LGLWGDHGNDSDADTAARINGTYEPNSHGKHENDGTNKVYTTVDYTKANEEMWSENNRIQINKDKKGNPVSITVYSNETSTPGNVPTDPSGKANKEKQKGNTANETGKNPKPSNPKNVGGSVSPDGGGGKHGEESTHDSGGGSGYKFQSTLDHFKGFGRWLWDNKQWVLEFAGGVGVEIIGFTFDLGTILEIPLSIPTGGGTLVLVPITVSGSTTAKVVGGGMIAHALFMMKNGNGNKNEVENNSKPHDNMKNGKKNKDKHTKSHSSRNPQNDKSRQKFKSKRK